MDASLDRLEKLKALHDAGALTAEEFSAQKTLILELFSTSSSTPPARQPDLIGSDGDLSATWQERFAFFDTYGAPESLAGRASIRQLSFADKFKINFNPLAFLFGPFYFMALGLWKRVVGVIVFFVLVLLVDAIIPLPGKVLNAVGFGMAALYAYRANYAFYRKRREGRDTFNPFVS